MQVQEIQLRFKMNFIHEKIDMGYETLDRTDAPDGRRALSPSMPTPTPVKITALANAVAGTSVECLG